VLVCVFLSQCVSVDLTPLVYISLPQCVPFDSTAPSFHLLSIPALYKMKNSVICPNGFSLGMSQNKGVFSYHVFKKHLNGAKIANQEILVNRVALLFLRDSFFFFF